MKKKMIIASVVLLLAACAFAFRAQLASAFLTARERIFKTGSDSVIVGDDGFLFFAEEADSYTGVKSITDKEKGAIVQSLANLSGYANKNGADFLLIIAPDKATIYPDKLPDKYTKAETSDLDILYPALESAGIEYIDLRSALQSKAENELIYHRRDTHWNGLGAYYAFCEICGDLGKPVRDYGERITVNDFKGDLDALLYPGREMYDEDITFDFSSMFAYTSAYSTPMDMTISTRSDGEGKALIFRDSFANALIPYFASTFEEVRFERANPYKIDTLDTFDAQYVFVVIAERNIRDLIGADSRISN